MIVKTEYQVGETVWIHGVTPSNKLTKGKIIHIVDLGSQEYVDLQYIIEIPTHIEPLLEIRSWHTISQDDQGPVGSLRAMKEDLHPNAKKIRHIGFSIDLKDTDDDGPSPEEIRAALEKSIDSSVHKPLVLKDPKSKSYRRFTKKKTKND